MWIICTLFDELGTVLSPKKKDIKGTSTNKGELCMMLDPDADYAKDTCRMWKHQDKESNYYEGYLLTEAAQ